MAYARCPQVEALHWLVAHIGPTLLLAALGALIGQWILRVR